jgi:hypothetical protein
MKLFSLTSSTDTIVGRAETTPVPCLLIGNYVYTGIANKVKQNQA